MALVGVAVCGITPCFAQESGSSVHRDRLRDVLVYTYEQSPVLQSLRANLRAEEERLPQARSGWKPDIEANGNITSAKIDGSNFGGEGTDSKEVELNINQPLYRGGRTVAATDNAKNMIAMENAVLEMQTQNLLRDAAIAYMNVYRDQALLELSVNNETVIKKQLEATSERFEVGELTKTDVSQAEARLARAESDRIRAHGDLLKSKAEYQEVTGLVPGQLVFPKIYLGVPDTLADARAMADQQNTAVIATSYMHRRSE